MSPMTVGYQYTQNIFMDQGAEVGAFLARTSGLDATHQAAYTTLINGLITDGVWTKLDVLYIFATQDSTTALLNLKSSSYTGVTHGSPTFTADAGFTGVDASSTVYIDTQFNPSTAGGNYTQDSAHISAWNVTNTTSGASGGGIIGDVNGNPQQTNIIPRYSDGKAYFRINGANVAGTLNGVARGHYIANRASSAGITGYKDGVSILTNGADTSSALVNGNMEVLAMGGASPGFGGGFQIASASIGASLTATEAANLYARLQTYMIAVGVVGSAVLPTTVSSALLGWWDSQKTPSFTLTGGTNVNSVADQSGLGNTMNKAGSTNFPIYSTSGVNGLPSIGFTGTSIAALEAASFPMGTGNTLTVWYVGTLAQALSDGFARYFSYSALPGTHDDWNYVGSWSFNTNSPASSTAFNFQRNSVAASGVGNASPAINRIILTINSSGAMTVYVNGVSAATGTSSGNWDTGGTIGWGRNGFGNFNYASMTAGELGVSSAYSDATAVAALDTYLKNKWGL